MTIVQQMTKAFSPHKSYQFSKSKWMPLVRTWEATSTSKDKWKKDKKH